MSDPAFDALRASGEYPPKLWSAIPAHSRRAKLVAHFAKSNAEIEPWMEREAEKLGIAYLLPAIGEETP